MNVSSGVDTKCEHKIAKLPNISNRQSHAIRKKTPAKMLANRKRGGISMVWIKCLYVYVLCVCVHVHGMKVPSFLFHRMPLSMLCVIFSNYAFTLQRTIWSWMRGRISNIPAFYNSILGLIGKTHTPSFT